jgi:hypothetical protein
LIRIIRIFRFATVSPENVFAECMLPVVYDQTKAEVRLQVYASFRLVTDCKKLAVNKLSKKHLRKRRLQKRCRKSSGNVAAPEHLGKPAFLIAVGRCVNVTIFSFSLLADT